MRIRRTELTYIIILGIGAFISFVITLQLVLNLNHIPQLNFRSIILSQEIDGLLSGAISFFSVLTAGFIAALAVLYANIQTQTYSWRRDQALVDIEKIYEPLYQDASEIVRATESLDYFSYSFTTADYMPRRWKTIMDSFLGTKLKLMDKTFYEKLEEVFGTIQEYVYKRISAWDIISETKRQVIDSHLSQQLSSQQRDDLLQGIESNLNYSKDLFGGFLMGRPNTDWSSLKQKQEDVHIINYILSSMKVKAWWQYQQFTNQEIETILVEVYQNLQRHSQLRQIIEWCKNYNKKATKLKKQLEDCIIRPQLS